MVSVIIPTRNAATRIGKLLETLRRQTIRHEVIVVDSSSTDRTAEISESYGATVLRIRKEDFNHGRTRNFAVSHAAGEIFVFLTQDALPAHRRCIENLVKPLSDPGIAASYGRQIPGEGAVPPERFTRSFNYPETPSVRKWEDVPELGIKAFFFSNVCSAVRRTEFKKSGGFPDNLIMFEDMLLAARLMREGYGVAYVPDAKVIHSHNYNFRGQFKRYAQAGISFSHNPWFLEYAPAHNQGAGLLRQEIKYLQSEKMYYWSLYALVEAFFKYSGYMIGLKHGKFPKVLMNWVARISDD